MNRTEFTPTIEAIYEEAASEFKNPFLTIVKFVFADNKPNANNQGIKQEDFAQVMQTAIDTPIKMRYLGEAGAGGHNGSVTIGHIRSMYEDVTSDGTARLIAEGVVYRDEFPAEAEYLMKSFNEGKAPGASWEINYRSEEKEGPVQWLKGIITRAATFVRNPAYGTRTALLALASDANISDEDLGKELLAFVQEISPKNENKGGSNKVEDELKKLEAELEAKVAEIAALTQAKAELEAKVATQDEVITEFRKKQLIEERTSKVTEAGLKLETDPEKLAKKQEFWINLSDDAFSEYVADLQAASKASKPAAASVNTSDDIPRVDATENTDTHVSLDEMKAKFRTFNRAGK